jgi:hypothetical protein
MKCTLIYVKLLNDTNKQPISKFEQSLLKIFPNRLQENLDVQLIMKL